MPMKELNEFIRLLEAGGKERAIPWEVVEFLVRMYAESGNPPLEHYEGSFSDLATTSRVSIPGGVHIEWSNIGGLYNPERHALVINTSALGDLKKRVLDILHEIQHYNQHVSWERDMAFRDRFTAGKRLPKRMQDTDYGDPMLLYEISWVDMTKEWVRIYGYANAPHEVDARRFANRNIDEAMAFIKEHFKLV